MSWKIVHGTSNTTPALVRLSDDTAVPTEEHKMNAETEQFGIVKFHMSRISHLVNDDTEVFFNK